MIIMEKLKRFFRSGDDHSEISDVSAEINANCQKIKRLKSIDSDKYPENSLYEYLYYMSDLQIFYNDRDAQRLKINTEDYIKAIDLRFIKKLIKYNNKYDNELIKFKNNYGDSALFQACKLNIEGSTKLVDMLVENGSNILEKNLYGHTVLHFAARFDNVDLMRHILSKFPETKELINAKTFGEKQSPYHYAIKNGNLNSLVFFKEECNVGARELFKEKDYQNRDCLFLASEYGHSNVVEYLLNEESYDLNIRNIYGQNALYWIIYKCPKLASQVLQIYMKKDMFTLDHLEIEIESKKTFFTRKEHVPHIRTILQLIVSNKQLGIIEHPFIKALIDKKWSIFGKWRSLSHFFFTFLFILTWNLLATLVPKDQYHIYEFPQDLWRLLLYLVGVFGVLIIIFLELVQYYSSNVFKQKLYDQRLYELEEDHRYCHPLDKRQNSFFQQERDHLIDKKAKTSTAYLREQGNWIDLFLIILLLTVIFTHLDDVLNHTEEKTRNHLRVFAITVVFISVNLPRTFRYIFESFGILVMMLQFASGRVLVWLFVFICFWVPNCTYFWMLYGGKHFESIDDNIPSECVDIQKPGNCTIVEADNMDTYNNVMFLIWSITMGREFDRESMYQVDPVMTDFSIIFTVSLFVLTLINVFIAFMTSTFDRVYNSSSAFFTLERAKKIVSIENEHFMHNRRIKHLKDLKKNPVENNRVEHKLDLEKLAINRINKSTGKMKIKLDSLNKKFREILASTRNNYEKKGEDEEKLHIQQITRSQFENLSTEIESLKNLVLANL